MPDMVAVDASFFPSPEVTALHSAGKILKRKAISDSFEDILTSEGRDARIKELNLELGGLFSYYKELSDRSVVNFNWPDNMEGLNLNALVSCSIEESSKPLTMLVDDVLSKFSKYPSHAGMTAATVKSLVLTIGQRSFYGVANAEADILEDDSESCLWCWETRNLKLMPKSVRGVIKVRRIGRKKIHIRITAISDMINMMAGFDADRKNEHTRQSENLLKVLGEDDIRSLMHSITQKNLDDCKGLDGEEKSLSKQLERSRREKRKQERVTQREKMQNEKALKRQRMEAERDEKRRENEMKKRREEAERDERKREKEEAEQRRHTAVQKQASIMERFVKKKKSTEEAPVTATAPASLVSRTMDAALAAEEADLNAITRSHVSSWRSIGKTMRVTARASRWGVRKASKIPTTVAESRRARVRNQLLQFDKTHCPAFYGTWPRRSEVVGPRHPLRKDPDLDYEFDSDGEWEEEDPGESLSDCEEEEEDVKSDENEYASEDEFLVPDGYLSENEGVDVDRGGVEEGRCSAEEEERGLFVMQQKQLRDVTDHALMRNHAFVVVNLVPGVRVKNVEYACLQALTMMPFPGGGGLLHAPADIQHDQQLLLSFDLSKMVSVIQSCRHGINRVLECLQQEFPSVSKSQLKNRVREIATFADNRWQVRKDVMEKLGISSSPERVSRNKTIISFFSKRCLPPPRVDRTPAP